MAKSVTLSTGRAFPTITAAKNHFEQVLNDQELKKAFSGDNLVS